MRWDMGSDGKVKKSKDQRTVAPKKSTGMVRVGNVKAKAVSTREMADTMNPFLGNSVERSMAIVLGQPDVPKLESGKDMGASLLGVRDKKKKLPYNNGMRMGYSTILGAPKMGSWF